MNSSSRLSHRGIREEHMPVSIVMLLNRWPDTRSSRLVRLSSVACLASHQRQQLRVDAGRNSLGMGEQLSLAASPPPLLCCHEILCTVPSTEDTRHRQETAMPPCSPPPVGATSGHVEASAARATTWCRREGGSWSLQMSEKFKDTSEICSASQPSKSNYKCVHLVGEGPGE